MDVNAGSPKLLQLIGFPHPATWPQGLIIAINALAAEWTLIHDQTAAPDADEYRPHNSWLDSLFRCLDRALYGRADSATLTAKLESVPPAGPLDTATTLLAYTATGAKQQALLRKQAILYIEYEGLALGHINDAARDRLAIPGATLAAKVWSTDGYNAQLLFHGELDMDHRSLCKSTTLIAAKVPALLRGALARQALPTAAGLPQPRATQAPRSATHLFLRLLRAIIKKLLWRDQWRLEIFTHTEDSPTQARFSHVIAPPASDFWADPFLVKIKNRLWLVFEALPFSTGKGNISAMELTPDGQPKSAPQIVLDEPWHLSYPFLFTENEQTYMIPDASMSRQLYLYRCGDDPLNWEKLAPLISDQSLADATLIRYQNKLWMFASHGDRGASMDDTLHIYMADQLTGPWKAHSLNPVKIDARSSRPAGNMWISKDGNLHRVAQDCSTVYGGATVCTRIVKLSETEFEEEIVQAWGSEYNTASTPWHTFNQLDGIQVIDRLQISSRYRS
ncbi:glucosamine inositolphosphorylceramide transferase family protein [Pseudoduganella danionis]